MGGFRQRRRSRNVRPAQRDESASKNLTPRRALGVRGSSQAQRYLPRVLKRLELYWRKLWIRLLTGLMRRPAASTPTWGSRPHRVLFLRHDRVGDMIFSTAVMRAIAKSHPSIELDVLASPANASVLDEATYVSNVIVFDKRNGMSYPAVARRLRERRYDAVIDCMVDRKSTRLNSSH